MVITHPEIMREAFDKAEFSDRFPYEVFVRLSKAEGLIYSSYNENWRALSGLAAQRLWNPAAVSEACRVHFEPAIDEAIERIGVMADTGQTVSIHKVLIEAGFNLTFRTIFGWPEDITPELLDRRETLRDHVAKFNVLAASPTPSDFFPWARALMRPKLNKIARHRDLRDKLYAELVESVHQRRSAGLPAATGIVDVMLEKEQAGELSRDKIHAICMDLMAAIPSGVAATATWFLLIVANRPNVQSRIHEELDQIIGRDGPPPSEDDRGRLPYTFACLAESMRYRTIAPIALPHRTIKETEVAGFRIPANTQVLGSLHAVHHHPEFWEAPDEFIPDRFLPGEDGSPSPALSSDAYMPFGIGIRRCTGDGFAVSAAWLHATRILHRLHFEPADGIPVCEDELFAMSVEPKPFVLNVARRQ